MRMSFRVIVSAASETGLVVLLNFRKSEYRNLTLMPYLLKNSSAVLRHSEYELSSASMMTTADFAEERGMNPVLLSHEYFFSLLFLKNLPMNPTCLYFLKMMSRLSVEAAFCPGNQFPDLLLRRLPSRYIDFGADDLDDLGRYY